MPPCMCNLVLVARLLLTVILVIFIVERRAELQHFNTVRRLEEGRACRVVHLNLSRTGTSARISTSLEPQSESWACVNGKIRAIAGEAQGHLEWSVHVQQLRELIDGCADLLDLSGHGAMHAHVARLARRQAARETRNWLAGITG